MIDSKESQTRSSKRAFRELKSLVDVSDIFIFSARGKGKEVWVNREGGGSVHLLKIPRGGGSPRIPKEGGGGEGAGRVSAGNLKGGGVNFFFVRG